MLLTVHCFPVFFSASIRAERPSRRLLAVPRAHAFMYYQCVREASPLDHRRWSGPINEKHTQV